MGKLHFFAQPVWWGHLLQCEYVWDDLLKKSSNNHIGLHYFFTKDLSGFGYVCTYSAEHVQESSKHCHGSAGSVRHAVHQSEQTSFRVSMIQELRFEELTH